MTTITIDEIKEVYKDFAIELNQWQQSNKLTKIKDYKDYHNPQVWGQDYKNDQHYFESVSSYKNLVFGLISVTERTKADGDRVIKTKADSLLSELDIELKKLDNLLFTARERLKFYENIMRVMGNITWGSY